MLNLSIPYVLVDTSLFASLAAVHKVRQLPTFIFFHRGQEVSRVQGAEPPQLLRLMNVVRDAAETQAHSLDGPGGETATGASTSTSAAKPDAAGAEKPAALWLGAALPRGYVDITGSIDTTRAEALNIDDAAGSGVRSLLAGAEPQQATSANGVGDYVVSDVDDQLMVFLPLQSTARVHTLQLTSKARLSSNDDRDDDADDNDDDDDDTSRPELLRIYANPTHVLGFDEAEATQATQEITIRAKDWNERDTASLPLQFVKFQNVSSLVIFVVRAHGGAERVRLDRVRLVGEAGAKREMGQLTKIEDED